MKNTLKVISLLLVALIALLCFASCAETGKDGEATTTAGENANAPIKNGKRVAFTFDDGPHAPKEDLEEGYYPYTTYILDKIEELGVHATFFTVGNRASSYPAALKRAVSLGCEIGSHTYEHTSFKGADNDTIKNVLDKASGAIAQAGVTAPKLFRPVGGAVTEDQLKYISSLGYSVIGWSVDPEDWNGNPKTGDKLSDDPERNQKYEAFVSQKVNYILSNVKDGDIILLHDIYMSSYDIFCRVADKLVADGYELVTVSELLGLGPDSAARPVMYISRDESITHMD